MKRQVARLDYNGIYRVIEDDAKTNNKFIVYREWHDGNGKKHKTKEVEYADLMSALYLLYWVTVHS